MFAITPAAAARALEWRAKYDATERARAYNDHVRRLTNLQGTLRPCS